MCWPGDPLDHLRYEILAAPDATGLRGAVLAVLTADPVLSSNIWPWTGPGRPAQSDLYVLILAVSAGLRDTPSILDKVRAARRDGFPVIPVVATRRDPEVEQAPPDLLADAEALDEPGAFVGRMQTCAGLRGFEHGGRVLLRHGGAGGAGLARAIGDALLAQGVEAGVEVGASGGRVEQVRTVDLLFLAAGGGAPDWLVHELDQATAARVPAIVLGHGAHTFPLGAPQIYGETSEVAAEAVRAARRILGRRAAFARQVGRVITHLEPQRHWSVARRAGSWTLRNGASLHVEAAAGPPLGDRISQLRERCAPTRGVLVAGNRPFSPPTQDRLRSWGDGAVRVTSLPTMAAAILGRPAHPLRGRRVLLSVGRPSSADDRALADVTLRPFVAALAQALIEQGATLVLGVHPSVAPMLDACIHDMVARGAGAVELHQARRWSGAASLLDEVVLMGPMFDNVRFHGHGDREETDVAAMRHGMIRAPLDAAVFVGGETERTGSGEEAGPPAIVDEHARFAHACPDRPAFVVGLAGGAARTLPVDERPILRTIAETADPDLAVALIIAELLGS